MLYLQCPKDCFIEQFLTVDQFIWVIMLRLQIAHDHYINWACNSVTPFLSVRKRCAFDLWNAQSLKFSRAACLLVASEKAIKAL